MIIDTQCSAIDLHTAKILVVDDEPTVRELVSEMLDREVAEITCAGSIAEARQLARTKQFDMALLDIMLPDGSGGECIPFLRATQKSIAIILITGHTTRETVASLATLGIGALLSKPFSRTELKGAVAREFKRMKADDSIDASLSLSSEAPENDLFGNSDYIRGLRHKIVTFSRGDIPVLIQGPTGTGKEIIARTIHARSCRKLKPMMIVNSSAIPEHLEESEFFGHAKGAFTGAHESKDGILNCAHGTTLFLDEVGDLSLRMQAKLLRVLDGHEFCRVGDSRPQKSDFRLISATNRPLLCMVKEGIFREDLYFRLKAGTIETLPLSHHPEDVPCMVKHFISQYNLKSSRPVTINREALSELVNHDWPGNVRELKNTIESLCVIAGANGAITTECTDWIISGVDGQDRSAVVPFSEAKIDFEKKYYQGLMDRYGGNVSMAARAAGIERAYFSKRLKALGLNVEDFRHAELIV
jgi:DNA-binding NtrC family response regulator